MESPGRAPRRWLWPVGKRFAFAAKRADEPYNSPFELAGLQRASQSSDTGLANNSLARGEDPHSAECSLDWR